MLNPLTLNPLQIKLALVSLALTLIALLSLTTWALLERSGRLGCKVELVRAQDQVDVLSDRLDEQTAAINALGQATAGARGELRAGLLRIEQSSAGVRNEVAGLEKSIKDPTPRAADGRILDCRDAIKAWREEKKK